MARKSAATHLFRKRGIYYFQRRVPKRVAKHYRSGRVEVSLRTARRDEALVRSREVAAQLEAFWYTLQTQNRDVPCEHLLVSAQKDQAAELTLDDVTKLYRERRGDGKGKTFHNAIDRTFGYFRKVAGNRPIGSYTRQDALKLRDHLKDKGLAPQSVQRAFTTLRSAFNLAISEHSLALT